MVGQPKGDGDGITLRAGSTYNFIAGNYIGTDATGNSSKLLSRRGISLQGAAHNAIQSNLISGTQEAGIALAEGADFNWLRANRITQNSNFGIRVRS